MIAIPTPEQFPRLSAGEEKLSMAKYYYRPLPALDPVYERALAAPAMRPEEIPDPNRWTELLLPKGYQGSEMGYGMMADGAGYLSLYTADHLPAEMKDWWFSWMMVRPKGMPEGQGNLCYKLWCPPDHFDADAASGCTSESLDLGQGAPREDIFMHMLSPTEYGLSPEMAAELAAAGVTVQLGYETFDHPGTHVCLRWTRPLPGGGVEAVAREWLGYRPENGRFVRDETTPVTEKYLRDIVIHNALETKRLEELLPELYAEYKDAPLDVD